MTPLDPWAPAVSAGLWALWACGLPCRFVALWFLIHRSGVLPGAIGLAGRCLRDWRGWTPAYRPDADCSNEFIDAVLLICDHGYQRTARAVLAVATAPIALGQAGSYCIPFACLCLAWDLAMVCLVIVPGALAASHTNKQFRVIHPPDVVPRHWVVFQGALCAAFYYCGVMHSVYTRYGKEQFADLGVGFAGASSGSYSAGYAGAPVLHGPYDSEHWAMTQMLFPFQYFDLMPLGILFAAGTGVKESGMWGMRTCRKFPNVCDSLAGGSYLMWLLHPFVTSSRISFWRRVVKCTAADTTLFGDQCNATGYLPGLFPGLFWHCHGAAVDGFLHFALGKYMLNAPVLADPRVCPGRCLVFGFSSDATAEFVVPEGVGIDLAKWRSFSLWSDFLMCLGSASHARRLFDWGVADADQNAQELDAAILEAFGLEPRKPCRDRSPCLGHVPYAAAGDAVVFVSRT